MTPEDAAELKSILRMTVDEANDASTVGVMLELLRAQAERIRELETALGHAIQETEDLDLAGPANDRIRRKLIEYLRAALSKSTKEEG